MSLCDRLLTQCPAIDRSLRPKIIEWQTLFIRSYASISIYDLDKEVIDLIQICLKPNRTKREIEIFTNVFYAWTATLPVNDLGAALEINLNLKKGSGPAIQLQVAVNIEKRVLNGLELADTIEAVRKMCRTHSGRGFYDQHNRLESIVTRWYDKLISDDLAKCDTTTSFLEI